MFDGFAYITKVGHSVLCVTNCSVFERQNVTLLSFALECESSECLLFLFEFDQISRSQEHQKNKS